MIPPHPYSLLSNFFLCKEKCQSSGNALYFHGDADSVDDDYQFVTTQDLNLWREEHSSNPALLQEFETMTHLTK